MKKEEETMQKHFVTFLSPGSFVHEETTKEIDSWDIDKAVEMSQTIIQRYNAIPFAFYFTTRERGWKDFDSKLVKTSCNYYLGGKVETLEEVEARNDPKEEILRSNMRGNGIQKIIVNTNSWRTVKPLEEDDVILPYVPIPPKKRKGYYDPGKQKEVD